MSDCDDKKENDPGEALQREILRERKFSLAEAIGREGGSLIKGHSPIPPLEQAIAEINLFIRNNLDDPSMALTRVLQKNVRNDRITIAESIDRPYVYLHRLVQSHIDNTHLFYELAREANFKWGQLHNERPRFQKPGEQPHPDIEYSHETVRHKLIDLLQKIKAVL
jgi:hypothetical protein